MKNNREHLANYRRRRNRQRKRQQKKKKFKTWYTLIIDKLYQVLNENQYLPGARLLLDYFDKLLLKKNKKDVAQLVSNNDIKINWKTLNYESDSILYIENLEEINENPQLVKNYEGGNDIFDFSGGF